MKKSEERKYNNFWTTKLTVGANIMCILRCTLSKNKTNNNKPLMTASYKTQGLYS